VVDELAVAQVFARALQFSPISIIPPISILIFILKLLTSGQKTAARERSNVAILFGVSETNGKESTSTFFSHPLTSKRVKLGNLPTKVMLWCKSESIKKENYFQSLKG
jgi:hypothetical protein